MKKIDLICAANVICHIPDLNNLIKSIDYLLTKNGFFIFEEPYLGSMFKKILMIKFMMHTYICFHFILLKKFLLNINFELIDALPQKTHGGSMRYVD
jgi:methylation protein EvaC